VTSGAVYIGLGSNLGDRFVALETAFQSLKVMEDSQLTAVSGIYETSPVGVNSGLFLNAVAGIATGLSPRRLLARLLSLENDMGRARGKVRGIGSKGARVIDLDLLLYGDTEIHDRDFQLPHPRMLHRRFVMEPLAELAPDLKIPPSGISARTAAARLAKYSPEQEIRRLGTLEEIKESSRFEV